MGKKITYETGVREPWERKQTPLYRVREATLWEGKEVEPFESKGDQMPPHQVR